MTETTWPGKPGVPMNPEKDGWHWLKARPEKLSALREKFPALWTAGNQHWIRGTYPPEYAAENWLYLAPCLAPDEVQNLHDDLAGAERERAHQHGRADRNAAEHAREQAKREALQKRVAELEDLIRAVHRNAKNLAGDRTFDQCITALMWIDDLCRAALTGGKDE